MYFFLLVNNKYCVSNYNVNNLEHNYTTMFLLYLLNYTFGHKNITYIFYDYQ